MRSSRGRPQCRYGSPVRCSGKSELANTGQMGTMRQHIRQQHPNFHKSHAQTSAKLRVGFHITPSNSTLPPSPHHNVRTISLLAPMSFSQKIVNEAGDVVKDIFLMQVLGNHPIQDQTRIWTSAVEELREQLVSSIVILFMPSTAFNTGHRSICRVQLGVYPRLPGCT
jgi:hypothetical protein